MQSDDTGTVDRRKVMKTLGAGGIVGLAGCTGGGDGGDGSGDGGDGSGDGGDGGDGGDMTTTEGDGGDGGSMDSVLIGQMSAYSGGLAWIGPRARKGIEVAQKQINDAGGITSDGLDFEFTTQDTETQPSAALTAFENLVSQNVVGIIGASSTVTPNLFEPINNTEILYCTPFAGTPQVDEADGRWIYRSVAGDSIVGPALAQYALDQGFETMYVTFKDDKGSQGFSVSVANYFEDNGGELVGETALAPQAQSYRSEIEQITAAEPDIVQMTAGLEVGGLFAQNWAERNIDIPVLVGNDVVNADFISRVGADAAQGFFGPTPGAGPSFDTFSEQYEAMHGEPPSAFTNTNYDTAIAFALALHRADEVSRPALADNMKAVCNPGGTEVTTFPEGKEELDAGNEVNFQGAGSNMNFTDLNNVIAPTNIQNVQDGAWTTVTTITAEDLEPPEGY